jgi:hypothetical protein
MTKHEIFKKLKSLNISKVYVMFSYENKNISIISNIVITVDGRYSVDWNEDVYSDKSYIVKPIFDFDKLDYNYIDGLLTWDAQKEKIIISGERKKINSEKFSQEIE